MKKLIIIFTLLKFTIFADDRLELMMTYLLNDNYSIAWGTMVQISNEGKTPIIDAFEQLFFQSFDPKYYEAIEDMKAYAKDENPEGYLALGRVYEEHRYEKPNYTKALEYYIKAAELGNSLAMYKVGEFYEKGLGTAVNLKESALWYEKASQKGNYNTIIKSARNYEEGIGVEKDLKKALELYEKSFPITNTMDLQIKILELKGKIYNDQKAYDELLKIYTAYASGFTITIGTMGLGELYYEGLGVEKDLKKAFDYYNIAAGHENGKAIEKLAWFYYKGEYVKKDLKKALETFEYAYLRNNRDVAYILGQMYYEGLGAKVDKNKGIEYYKISAKNGNIDGIKKIEELKKLGIIKSSTIEEEFKFVKESSSENNTIIFEKYKELSEKAYAPAMFELANCYEQGLGVEQNFEKAVELYEKSAKLENIDAMERLYEIYRGNPSLPKNKEKLKYYTKQLASSDEYYYIFKFGMLCLKDGEYARAGNLFRYLAEKDEGDGFIGLGIMLRDGLGLEKRYEKAYEFIKYAWSEKNNYYGVYELGWFYENGVIVKKDLEEAFDNYKTAANCGIEEALIKCGEMYEQGIGHGYAVNALDYYREAAQKGNDYAMYKLGKLYEEGKYEEKNLKYAKYWYEKASEGGNEEAKKALDKLNNIKG